MIMAAGKPCGLQPGHTSTIRRVEGAMLSYHADMDIRTNPYELGLGRLVNLEMEADFVGKAALKSIQARGVSRLHVGLEIDGPPLVRPNTKHWTLTSGEDAVGHITSAVYSPRLEKNIALGMVTTPNSSLGTKLKAQGDGGDHTATVVEKPFFDPKKTIASAA